MTGSLDHVKNLDEVFDEVESQLNSKYQRWGLVAKNTEFGGGPSQPSLPPSTLPLLTFPPIFCKSYRKLGGMSAVEAWNLKDPSHHSTNQGKISEQRRAKKTWLSGQ